MFDRAPQDNELRRVMDACLPGLENRPDFDRDVLRQVRGEVKVKKKLSVGFVLVIVLVLAAVTALAAALLWEQQVVPMKEIEQAEGDYVNWSISQKQALIRALIDSGNIEETAETARLFDDSTGETEKQAIANQLVLTLTGQTDVKEINVDIITYAIMGSTDKWTLEQRVWWQQVTNQFRNSGDDPDILITPNGKEPTETEAIAIAKAAILSAYELPSDALDNAQAVANLYVTDQRPDYRRWDVQFKVFRDGSDSYTERIYVAIVDEQGKIIADPDVSMPSVNDMAAIYKNMKSNDGNSVADMYMQYMKQAGNKIFQLWSLDTVDKSVVLWYNEEKRTGVFLHGEQLSTARYVRCDVGNSQAVHNRKQGNVGRERKGYPSISEWRVLDFENGSTMERPAAGIW